MKAYNKSNKVIGIGGLILLPEETRDVPAEYENSKILSWYREQGLIDLRDGNAAPSEDELKAAIAAAQREQEAAKKAKAEAEAAMAEAEAAKAEAAKVKETAGKSAGKEKKDTEKTGKSAENA